MIWARALRQSTDLASADVRAVLTRAELAVVDVVLDPHSGLAVLGLAQGAGALRAVPGLPPLPHGGRLRGRAPEPVLRCRLRVAGAEGVVFRPDPASPDAILVVQDVRLGLADGRLAVATAEGRVVVSGSALAVTLEVTDEVLRHR